MSGKIDLSSIIFHPVMKKPSDLYKIGEKLHEGLSYRIIDINDPENEIVISDKLGNIYVYSSETGECLTDTLLGLEDYRLPRIVENNCPQQTSGVNLKALSNLNINNHCSSFIFSSWLRDCLKKHESHILRILLRYESKTLVRLIM